MHEFIDESCFSSSGVSHQHHRFLLFDVDFQQFLDSRGVESGNEQFVELDVRVHLKFVQFVLFPGDLFEVEIKIENGQIFPSPHLERLLREVGQVDSESLFARHPLTGKLVVGRKPCWMSAFRHLSLGSFLLSKIDAKTEHMG